jgi:predicted nucleic acid-binding protein
MTGYVVDASVAVKWLITETFSDQAVRLLDREFTLVAPELLFAEAANALWVMCRRGDITASAARPATDLDHPTYDCFYLALAVQEQYPVVTADQRFYDIVHKHPYLSDRVVHVASLQTR